MMRAAGRPNCSSPVFRSCCERSLKSWSRVFSPVTLTLKLGSASASFTAEITSAISSSSTEMGTRMA
jgi:hypothetical protein